MPDFAEHVVIDLEAHRFDVDDQKFPWFISEAGPKVKQLLDDLYEVRVTVFVHNGFFCAGMHQQPVLSGIVFPWHITEDGMTYTATRTGPPQVELAFLAKHVEAECIDDVRERYDLGKESS